MHPVSPAGGRIKEGGLKFKQIYATKVVSKRQGNRGGKNQEGLAFPWLRKTVYNTSKTTIFC
jgi:hypothetical protein